MKKKLVKKFHEETRNFEARKNLKKDSPKKKFHSIQLPFWNQENQKGKKFRCNQRK